MVNAQQEIERRFPKNVNGIYLVNVNLEGDLDLSEYTNLSETVDIGSNMPRLRSIKIPPFSQITWMSIFGTGINDFSFLVNLPYIKGFCFPKPVVSNKNNAEVAKAIRDVSR
ncbi:13654_t:CDS:1, partial [Entrophospora sp. SA101]